MSAGALNFTRQAVRLHVQRGAVGDVLGDALRASPMPAGKPARPEGAFPGASVQLCWGCGDCCGGRLSRSSRRGWVC